MEIKFPKLTREVDLMEYHPDIEMKLVVWVNPSIKVLKEFAEQSDKVRESKGEEGYDDYLTTFSLLLSQGKPETHFSVDDLRTLIEGTKDTDPAFWAWIHNKVFDVILDHRNGVQKN